MQSYFYAIADFLTGRLVSDEHFTCWFSAEESDFVRFNRGLIRQPGHVKQLYLNLELINGLRHANCFTALSGRIELDRELLGNAICGLRDQLIDLPGDPHLLISTEVCSTENCVNSRLPATGLIVDEILSKAESYDFVGILAAGPIYRGFANSYGQRNWHEISSFNLDWSLYHNRDKAVKTAYAGFEWDNTEFNCKFDTAIAQLDILKRKPVALDLGSYRAYLSPAAFGEIIAMLNWGGFSEKSLRTKHSPLRRMRDEDFMLSTAFTLSENVGGGIAPRFQKEGFIKPDQVTLIDRGCLVNSMVSPCTAKEYGLSTNGPGPDEMLMSTDVLAGTLPMSRILDELHTGIYIGNLWYLNFSDRANCRLTGMTRFATFWIENGEIVAPLNVMRFDDSLLNLLGEDLIGLTRERELLIDNESYGQRSTNSMRLPGALVKAFNFVL